MRRSIWNIVLVGLLLTFLCTTAQSQDVDLPAPQPVEPAPTPVEPAPTPVEPSPTPTVGGDPPPSQSAQPATPATTITYDEALDKATQEIPEPPTIFDITDPGIVYTKFREGVNAWRASLGGHRDRWGNLITDSYLTAERPDSVPASLIAFLLQYYKGDPDIGLGVGGGSAANAVIKLQRDYNTAIRQRADDIFEEANKSEDVPVLETNDNNTEDDPADDGSDDTTDDGSDEMAVDPPPAN